MRVAIDTNVLAYAEGVNGPEKKETALQLIENLPVAAVFLPAQTLGELFQLLVRKVGRTPQQARMAILSWCDAFAVIETSKEVIVTAAELAVRHRIAFWDAVVLGSAAEGGCRLLLSEDLQDGFTWNDVTVTNPFGPSKHSLLENLLREGR